MGATTQVVVAQAFSVTASFPHATAAATAADALPRQHSPSLTVVPGAPMAPITAQEVSVAEAVAVTTAAEVAAATPAAVAAPATASAVAAVAPTAPVSFLRAKQVHMLATVRSSSSGEQLPGSFTFLKKRLKHSSHWDDPMIAWSLRRPRDLILHAAYLSRHSAASADCGVARPLSPHRPHHARLTS